LWIGRTIGSRVKPAETVDKKSAQASYVLSDRAVAIWALACLVMIVPAGITGLQILVR
jgi:uncharacterized protein with von Willebrand factor type A (vWA) domain